MHIYSKLPQTHSVEALEKHLAGDKKLHSSALIDTYVDDQRTLHLEFSSMVEAHFAYEVLIHWVTFTELRPFFSPDPCANNTKESRQRILPSNQEHPKSHEAISESTHKHECLEILPQDHCEVKSMKTSDSLQSKIRLTKPPEEENFKFKFCWADEVIEEEKDEGQNFPNKSAGLASSKYAPTNYES